MTDLLTERLRLRRWRPEDRAPFAALNADPEVMRYFPAPLTQEQSDAFVDRIEAAFDEHGYGLWAVEVLDSAPFIGFIGLAWQRFEAPFTPALEVGWRLAREHWGRGYAPEGARAALTVAFGTASVGEVVSMTAFVNEPSRRVMEKLGMTRDAADDFDHPNVPAGPLRHHVLYRIARGGFG
jgi:ribosomal-protein-alanine N-acetyltransferase